MVSSTSASRWSSISAIRTACCAGHSANSRQKFPCRIDRRSGRIAKNPPRGRQPRLEPIKRRHDGQQAVHRIDRHGHAQAGQQGRIAGGQGAEAGRDLEVGSSNENGGRFSWIRAAG
jgi:hypothetical protein